MAVLFSNVVFVEHIPAKALPAFGAISFRAKRDGQSDQPYRLIPCNMNLLHVAYNATRYRDGYFNGSAVDTTLRMWSEDAEGNEDVFTHYRYPKYITAGQDSDNAKLMDVYQHDTVKGMDKYISLMLKRNTDFENAGIDVNSMVRRVKDYMLRVFTTFVKNELSGLENVSPFIAKSSNLDMFKVILAMDNRTISNYNMAYLNESKTMFVQNLLTVSLNKFLSKYNNKSVNDGDLIKIISDKDLDNILNKLALQQNNLWQFARIIKYELINDEESVKMIWGVLCGRAEAVSSIADIPSNVWLGDGLNYSFDKTNQYASIEGGDINQIAVLLQYDKAEEYLFNARKYVLKDIVLFSESQAIFKLIDKDVPNAQTVVSKYDIIGGKYVESIVLSKESDLINMTRSKIKDMLLILTKLSIYGYEKVSETDGEKLEQEYMQLNFKALFYKKYINEVITNKYDKLFDTIINVVNFCDPNNEYDEDETKLHNKLDSLLHKIKMFITAKLEVLEIDESDKHIDKYLSQLINIHKNEMLRIINVD